MLKKGNEYIISLQSYAYYRADLFPTNINSWLEAFPI